MDRGEPEVDYLFLACLSFVRSRGPLGRAIGAILLATCPNGLRGRDRCSIPEHVIQLLYCIGKERWG